jgi:hypothetical protein
MSPRSEHGAFGSNAPLERVPVEEPEIPQPVDGSDELFPEVERQPLKNAEEDVVYLREDLRPR